MLTRTAFRVRTLAHNSRFSTWSPHIEPDSGDRNLKNIPRPSTVPWSDHLHNSVSLIGNVEYQLRRFDFIGGGLVANTVLLVKPRPPFRNYLWVTVAFWDLLAERALAHLKPNECIYVSGQLRSYIKHTLEGTERMSYKVLAKELNYVQVPDERCLVAAESGSVAGESLEQQHKRQLPLWQSLFANPNEWCDYRKTKKSWKFPDFKHKKTGGSLWLNKYNPSWVKTNMELLDSRLTETSCGELPSGTLTFDCTSGHQLASSDLMETNLSNLTNCSNIGESLKQFHMSRLALWQSLFANLDEWLDFRKTKKHPRQPDFVHKKTNEALWLNPEDPSWVKKHVELLDSGLTETPEMPFGSFTSDCVSGRQLASSDSTQTDLLNDISSRK